MTKHFAEKIFAESLFHITNVDPWNFFKSIGLNAYSQLGYLIGEFHILQLILFAVFGAAE